MSLLPAGRVEDVPRVLGVTETACAVRATNEVLLNEIGQACAAYPSLSVILNVFDAAADPAASRSLGCPARLSPNATVPACVTWVAHVPGMKAAFWRYAVGEAAVRDARAEVVWLFDNQMGVGAFDLRRAAATLLASGVAIAQPRVPPKMPNAVWKKGGPTEFLGLAASVPLQPAGCRAQAVTYVEVQTPILTAAAYVAVHRRLFQRLDMGIFNQTIYGLDWTWCKLAEIHRDAWDTTQQHGDTQRQQGARRPACAVLDSTISRHELPSTIDAVGKSKSVRSGAASFPWLAAHFPDSFLDVGDFERQRLRNERGECLLAGRLSEL